MKGRPWLRRRITGAMPPSAEHRPPSPTGHKVLAVVLACLGVVYTTLGLSRLVADVPGSFPIDLRLRWLEERLVVEGKNPQLEGHPDPQLPPSHEVMRKAGGSYPPWSYGLGLVLVPPFEWETTRWYFAGVSLASLGVLSTFACSRLRNRSRLDAAIGALLPFASFPAAICTSYGQYGVVISALQAGAIVLLDRNRAWSGGVLLGVGLVKPQLTALLCVGLLFRRQFSTIAAVMVVLAVATLVAAALMGADLSGFFVRATHESAGRGHESHNGVLIALTTLVGRRTAVPLLAAAGAALIAWAAVRLGDRDRLALASLAAVVTMYWSYRKHFDVALMTLPAIWLWRRYAETRQPADFALFLAVGLTLWLPVRDVQWDHPAVQYGHLVIWTWAGLRIANATK